MLENIGVVVGLVCLVGVVGLAIWQFMNMAKDRQIMVVQEWLLIMVVEAEKVLGANTGQIKLRWVYDKFVEKFKFLSMMVTFEQFSNMVDDALDTMRDMIQNNKNVKAYVEKGN